MTSELLHSRPAVSVSVPSETPQAHQTHDAVLYAAIKEMMQKWTRETGQGGRPSMRVSRFRFARLSEKIGRTLTLTVGRESGATLVRIH
jgi:hypothetical protein